MATVGANVSFKLSTRPVTSDNCTQFDGNDEGEHSNKKHKKTHNKYTKGEGREEVRTDEGMLTMEMFRVRISLMASLIHGRMFSTSCSRIHHNVRQCTDTATTIAVVRMTQEAKDAPPPSPSLP